MTLESARHWRLVGQPFLGITSHLPVTRAEFHSVSVQLLSQITSTSTLLQV